MEKPSRQFLKKAMNYLTPVIKEAGEMVLGSWGKIEVVNQKDKRDIATKTDVEVENFIKRKIMSKWPDHGFWGEEGDRVNSQSSYQWLIDPIDGTKNYINLAPFFQVHIALVFENEPILGIIYQPVAKQFFSAVEGGKTYLNGKIILQKEPVPLDQSITDIDLGGLADKKIIEKNWIKAKLYEIIERSYRVRISGGSFAIYLVTGAMDAYVDLAGSKPQDLAARIIIMREAGYKVEQIKTPFGEKIIAAREPIFSELKKILLN